MTNINPEIFKLLASPDGIQAMAKILSNSTELRKLYDDALKQNPDLENDVEGLYKVIFGGNNE